MNERISWSSTYAFPRNKSVVWSTAILSARRSETPWPGLSLSL